MATGTGEYKKQFCKLQLHSLNGQRIHEMERNGWLLVRLY
jgi:hypothetical protein